MLKNYLLPALVLGLISWSGVSYALTTGDRVPDVKVDSTGAEAVNLREVPGWKVVYFYPKSFTGGCTKQACALRDSISRFEDLDATIFGVSTDDLVAQKKFKAKHDLPFELLADDKKELSKAFDVMGIFGMSKRVSFIINDDGVVTDIIDSVSVRSHDQDVYTILEARKKAR